MDIVKDHQLIVHTKNSALGHFTVEIMGPSVSKGTSYVRGFGPDGDIKAGLSISTLDVTGIVRDDEKDMSETAYLSSEPVAITRAQAERVMGFVQNMKQSTKDYDLNDYNCVDFVNDAIKAAGLPGDVDDYLTKEQKQDVNGAQFYNDWVYGGPERPSMVDPLADHKSTFNRVINGAKYNGLMGELLREGAPQNLLDEIASGSASGAQPMDGINPSLGAAIMHGIEGRSMIGKPMQGGFSPQEVVASERARIEYERSGDVVKATQSAVDGIREAENYAGPSQDLSPEDTASVAENRAQLERNTQLLEARRASLLDGGRITIDGVPVNAARTAAASPAPATRAGAQRLYQQKVQAIHPDPVAARRAVRATLPEQAAMPDFAAVFNEAVDGLQSVFGVKTASAKEVTPARGQLESAKVAGLVMDKPMADKLMKTTAYNTKADILHDFAAQSARSFYDATYADNDAAAPTRTGAFEEPARQKAIADAQKVTERHNAKIAKENAAIDRQREADAAARSKSVSRAAANEEAGIADAVPTRTIKTAKVDRFGDNAVSAAPGGMLTAASENPVATDISVTAQAEQKAVMTRRAADTHERSQGSAVRTTGKEALYGANSTPGSLGTAGYKDAKGDYHSGTNSRGKSTGGVGVDAQGREIGAYGQHTRDIMGRKNKDGTSSSSNTRVICTELVRQGRMAPSLQRLDIAFTLRELSPATVRGYHFWAVPYVRLMKRSRIATTLIEPVATWRALEIAYQLGERDQPHYGGKLVRLVMEPACWVLGTVLGWLFEPDRFYPTLSGGR